LEIIAKYYKFFLGNCRKIVLKIEIVIYSDNNPALIHHTIGIIHRWNKRT